MLKYLRDYCHCDVAISGDEAITAFQLAWIEKDPYDVIYLDIVIPRSNGFEVLDYIRNYEKENDCPHKAKIIMVSALDDQNQIVNAYRNECDSYMVKPISMKKLKEVSEQAGVPLKKILR
jgi:two-component system chemotaxis response regulator CheY